MNLVVVGVNHKTAPVSLRARLAFAAETLSTAQNQLSQFTAGSVIISTCNRTEIYALAPEPSTTSHVTTHRTNKDDYNVGKQSHREDINSSNPQPATTQLVEQLSEWLATFQQLSLHEVTPYLYHYVNSQALTHWVRVAAGLDSMILGEPQIFGQIKRSVAHAKAEGYLTNHLQWVTEHVFSAAKKVRNETAVGNQAISLGFAAAKLVTQIFDQPQSTTLLVVAAGEMNRLVAQHITDLGVQRIIICNRSPERAFLLAEQLERPDLQIEVHSLNALADLLPQADIISSCSGSMDTLIDKKMSKKALKTRRYKPMLMVDLAVPHDIDPKVGKLDDIYLYSIDDLQHVIAGNLEKRRQAAVEAELLASQLVIEIEHRYQVHKVGHDIHQYREIAEQKSQALMQKALLKLQDSEQSPEAIIAELTHQLTRTLTHPPSHLMRQVARHGDTEMMEIVIEGLTKAYR